MNSFSSICLRNLNIFRRNIYAGIDVGWYAELSHCDDWKGVASVLEEYDASAFRI
jgi:hypothetical protein